MYSKVIIASLLFASTSALPVPMPPLPQRSTPSRSGPLSRLNIPNSHLSCFGPRCFGPSPTMSPPDTPDTQGTVDYSYFDNKRLPTEYSRSDSFSGSDYTRSDNILGSLGESNENPTLDPLSDRLNTNFDPGRDLPLHRVDLTSQFNHRLFADDPLHYVNGETGQTQRFNVDPPPGMPKAREAYMASSQDYAVNQGQDGTLPDDPLHYIKQETGQTLPYIVTPPPSRPNDRKAYLARMASDQLPQRI